MIITSEILDNISGEADAKAVYIELRQQNDFLCFARQFIYSEEGKVARHALWVLTQASDKELSSLQTMLHELIDLAMQTPSSAVRRMTLNIVSRLQMEEDDLRTDFFDFCLTHISDVEEFPGVQTLCIKLAFRMGSFYPELMNEVRCTLETMNIEFYKPAVKRIRDKVLSGKMK